MCASAAHAHISNAELLLCCMDAEAQGDEVGLRYNEGGLAILIRQI